MQHMTALLAPAEQLTLDHAFLDTAKCCASLCEQVTKELT
jgi:hypothetical protein